MTKYDDKFHSRRIGQPYYKHLADCISIVAYSLQIPVRSMLDVGCSSGALLDAYDVDKKCGIDNGVYDLFSADNASYIDCDFNESYCDTGYKYDLVVCQEVIEHINKENEDNVLKTITLNAHENSLIVFGGARVGQRGKGHVNCRHFSYWQKKMKRYGYILNEQRTEFYRKLVEDKVPSYYRINTGVYVYEGRCHIFQSKF